MVNRHSAINNLAANNTSAIPLIHRPTNEVTQHRWGVIYITSFGSAEIHLDANRRIIAPWQYAIWLPAHINHLYQASGPLEGGYICVHETLAERFPATPGILMMNKLSMALAQALINHPAEPYSGKCNRLALALLTELLADSKSFANYLPASQDRLLQPVLHALYVNPGDDRSLAQLAEMVGTSEKTLIRRFRSELALSFREWRTRLRFLHSIQLLATPVSIAYIARRLGYQHTSSFIAIFHRITGMSPDNYRRALPSSQSPSQPAADSDEV